MSLCLNLESRISNHSEYGMYDLIVIGAGPGGYEAAAHAGKMGMKDGAGGKRTVHRRHLPPCRLHSHENLSQIVKALFRMQKRGGLRRRNPVCLIQSSGGRAAQEQSGRHADPRRRSTSEKKRRGGDPRLCPHRLEKSVLVGGNPTWRKTS